MAAVCLDCFENLKNQFMEVSVLYTCTVRRVLWTNSFLLSAIISNLEQCPAVTCFRHFQAAKYGIPVDKRQYNWMQVPPPPEDAVTLITPQERLDRHIVSES